MRKPFSVKLLLGALAFSVLAAGCGKKEDKEAKEDVFKPEEMAEYEEKGLGFSIMKPKNLEAIKEGEDKVKFEAPGFPTVTVTYEETKLKTGKGTSGGSAGEGFKWSVTAPLRKLTCEAEATGEFGDLIEKMCKSLKHTKQAPKMPKATFSKAVIKGEPKKAEDLNKKLESLQPKITDCWKKAVSKDAELPAGQINVSLRFKPDGTLQSSAFTNNFNYEKSDQVVECVKNLFKDLKPVGKDVQITWRIDFSLYE
jgi:hypothetical protein